MINCAFVIKDIYCLRESVEHLARDRRHCLVRCVSETTSTKARNKVEYYYIISKLGYVRNIVTCSTTTLTSSGMVLSQSGRAQSSSDKQTDDGRHLQGVEM